ncbi:MAG: membrane dipeptidase [Deltaproteobacteria bacterium]|nr:membrane dipeptidase [Deltaproteobacteria bacterium]
MSQSPPSLVDVDALATKAGVSREASALLASAEVVDLHLETFIPPRLWGYDLHRSHAGRFPWGRFFGHLDLPRVHGGGLTTAMWSIATNILQPRARRAAVLQENVAALVASLERDQHVRVVTNARELSSARGEGRHAALVCVQGGNAFELRASSGAIECEHVDPSGKITRVTVVHLSSSSLGATSSPLHVGGPAGLSDMGRAMVRALDRARVFVDLAHVSEAGFWDAMAAHDRTLPAIVTHTGMKSVHDLWRNIDDRQARAIADTGGVIGVIFQASFLGPSWGSGRARDVRAVVAHLEAVIRAAGEEAAAIGSDYDGFILPTADLRDGELAYARLVQSMLEAGWREERIRNVLGLNFLRSFARLRPG